MSGINLQSKFCSFPVLIQDKKIHVVMNMLIFSHFAKQKNYFELTAILYLT